MRLLRLIVRCKGNLCGRIGERDQGGRVGHHPASSPNSLRVLNIVSLSPLLELRRSQKQPTRKVFPFTFSKPSATPCIRVLSFTLNRIACGSGGTLDVWEKKQTQSKSADIPEELLVPEKSTFRGVALGKRHAVLHGGSSSGTAWGVGHCGSGQLGFPLHEIVNWKNRLDPRNEAYKTDAEVPFVYLFQERPTATVAVVDEKGTFSPILRQPLEYLGIGKVMKVACGSFHTLFLTTEGSVLACGCYLNGRLGLGRALLKNVSLPAHVRLPVEQQFVNVSCLRGEMMG